MAGLARTGGTSQTGAVTLGLALIRTGTTARALETSEPVTRVPVTRVPVIRAGARAWPRGWIPPLTHVTFRVHARAAFRTPAWILALARSGLKVPIRAGGAVRARAGVRGPTWARILGLAGVGFRMLAGT